MSRERIRELWSARQLGTLDPAGAGELGRLLEEDASARREILDDLEIHGMLGQLRSAEDAEMFRRSLLERLSAEDSSSRFVRAVLKNPSLGGRHPARRPLQRRLRASGGGSGVFWLSLAAAALFAVALVLSLGRSARERTPSAPAPLEASRPETAPVIDASPGRVATVPSPTQKQPPPPEAPRPVPVEVPRPQAPSPEPPQPLPAPRPAEPPGTRSREQAPVLATIERVRGEVLVTGESGRIPARSQQKLTGGQGLLTIGRESLAALRFSDGTILELGGDTSVPRISDPVRPGKIVHLAAGGATADVARQPPAQPMIFTTPHAEARVLGTSLRLLVDADPKQGFTRLDVVEGRVRLTKLLDRNPMVEVPAGHFAVAAAGVELVVRKIVDDILLLPVKSRLVGSEWRLAKEDKSARGVVFEAPRMKVAHTENWATDFVEFTFVAEAGKEYTVWVRGRSTAAPDQNRFHADAVALEVFNGKFGRPGPWDSLASLNAYPFNGWGSREGYWWTGGDADSAAPNEPGDDRVPATITFSRHGPQVLRLHALETPLRIDAIWLSSSRKTRPEPERPGPGRLMK